MCSSSVVTFTAAFGAACARVGSDSPSAGSCGLGARSSGVGPLALASELGCSVPGASCTGVCGPSTARAAPAWIGDRGPRMIPEDVEGKGVDTGERKDPGWVGPEDVVLEENKL